jgi:hypothetical protein
MPMMEKSNYLEITAWPYGMVQNMIMDRVSCQQSEGRWRVILKKQGRKDKNGKIKKGER